MLKTLNSTLSSNQVRAKKFNKVGINLIWKTNQMKDTKFKAKDDELLPQVGF